MSTLNIVIYFNEDTLEVNRIVIDCLYGDWNCKVCKYDNLCGRIENALREIYPYQNKRR